MFIQFSAKLVSLSSSIQILFSSDSVSPVKMIILIYKLSLKPQDKIHKNAE